MSIFISLIIPVYNEEKRIKKNLQTIFDYLELSKNKYEIIIVNDGSTDNTPAIVDSFINHKQTLKIVNLPKNFGKGAAIRAGVKESQGSFIIFSDVDLSVPISVLPRFIKALEKGYDIALASRRTKGSKVNIRQNYFRQILGQGFTKLSTFFLQLNSSDVTCGFKAYHKKVAKKLFSKSKIDRWAFDAEIMYMARKYHYRSIEIPVRWSNKKGTKVKIMRDLPRTFLDIIRIRTAQ